MKRHQSISNSSATYCSAVAVITALFLLPQTAPTLDNALMRRISDIKVIIRGYLKKKIWKVSDAMLHNSCMILFG